MALRKRNTQIEHSPSVSKVQENNISRSCTKTYMTRGGNMGGNPWFQPILGWV